MTSRSIWSCSVTLAIALGCSAVVRANDASGPGVDAVRAKAAEVGGLNPMTPNPQWTPNGGVFQFYNDNDAAIYWSAATGAHLIHGDILRDWSARGFENGVGYPFDDEGPASAICEGGVRSQSFTPDGCDLLCWSPAVFTPDGLLTDARVWLATCPI
ncbi:MAG TPA: hypothetical protein VGI70_01940 [Polyangiales bacterium]|jgi:uncharacterized protein with LGFP repeats